MAGVTLTLAGSCQHRFIGQAADYDLETKRSWRSVRFVSARTTVLYRSPNRRGRKANSLVRGDALGIRSGWFDAEHVDDDEHITRGWTKATDVADEVPPR